MKYIIELDGMFYRSISTLLVHDSKTWTHDIYEAYRFDTKEEADYVADRVFDYTGGNVQVRELCL